MPFGSEPASGSGSALFLLLPLVLLGPAALTLWLLYRWHPGRRPPAQGVVQLFFAGFGTALPAIGLEILLFVALAPALIADASAWPVLGLLALGIGLSEEAAKYWFLARFGVKQIGVRSVYTGVLFGVAIGLGFATIENYNYIYGAASLGGGDAWFGFAFLRSVLPAPAHALLGALMGYGVGRAAVAATEGEARRWRRAAYLIPAVWHGLFDYCLLMAEEYDDLGVWLWYGVFGVVVLALWVTGICLTVVAHTESRPEPAPDAAPPAIAPPALPPLPAPVVAPPVTEGDLSVWARPQ